MRSILIAAVATLAMTTSGFATGKNDYQQTRPVVNQGGKGGTGVGVGVAKSNSSARASSSSSSRSSSSATGGRASSAASVSNSGNSSVTFKDRAQAPGFGLGGGASTAPCQSYTEFAVSFPGGGGGFGTGRSVGWCRDIWKAKQYEAYFGKGVVRQYMIESDPKLKRIVGAAPVYKTAKAPAKKRKPAKNCACK